MYWVVLCTSWWFLSTNGDQLKREYNRYPNTMTDKGCEEPKEVTKSEIEFYRSEDFKAMRSDTTISNTFSWTIHQLDPNSNEVIETTNRTPAEEKPKDGPCNCYEIIQTGEHEYRLVRH